MKIQKPVLHSIDLNEYINPTIEITPYEFKWAEKIVNELGFDFDEHTLLELYATPQDFMNWLIEIRRQIKRAY